MNEFSVDTFSTVWRKGNPHHSCDVYHGIDWRNGGFSAVSTSKIQSLRNQLAKKRRKHWPVHASFFSLLSWPRFGMIRACNRGKNEMVAAWMTGKKETRKSFLHSFPHGMAIWALIRATRLWQECLWTELLLAQEYNAYYFCRGNIFSKCLAAHYLQLASNLTNCFPLNFESDWNLKSSLSPRREEANLFSPSKLISAVKTGQLHSKLVRE